MAERTSPIAQDALALMRTSYDERIRAIAAVYDASRLPILRDHVALSFHIEFNEFAQKAARARTQSRAA